MKIDPQELFTKLHLLIKKATELKAREVLHELLETKNIIGSQKNFSKKVYRAVLGRLNDIEAELKIKELYNKKAPNVTDQQKTH